MINRGYYSRGHSGALNGKLPVSGGVLVMRTDGSIISVYKDSLQIRVSDEAGYNQQQANQENRNLNVRVRR